MASTMKKVFTFILLIFLYSPVLGELECYWCRGADCVDPTEDQVQTCGAENFPTTPTPDPEATTDTDMNFDQDFVQIVEYPLLESLENSEEPTKKEAAQLEIVSSRLPGEERFSSRRLQQSRDDGLRCVYATYNDPDSGDISTVRSCALLTVNNHQTCLSVVAGELVDCYVCDTDRCNSAVNLTGAVFTLLLSLMVAVRNI